MSGQLTLRTAAPHQPAAPVEEYTSNTRRITFRHPGYGDGVNILLTLSAFDNGGIHYETALVACAIVAGNRWDGYFKTTRDQLDAVTDTVLTAKTYYFYVPPQPAEGADWQYPTSPSFEHWKFPETLPPSWITRTQQPGNFPYSTSIVSNSIRMQPCTVTGHGDAVQAAFIVPQSEFEWFLKNNMSDYNLYHDLEGTESLNDISNRLPLRADVRIIFDDKKLIFTPKQSRWVAHFLQNTLDLGALFHNTPVEIGQIASPEFLLARFAWAIFPSANVNLSFTTPRNMILLGDTGNVTTKALARGDLLSSHGEMVTRKRKRVAEMSEEGPSGDKGMLGYLETVMSLGESEYERMASSSPRSIASDVVEGETSLGVLKRRWLIDHRPCSNTSYCCDYHSGKAITESRSDGYPCQRGASGL